MPPRKSLGAVEQAMERALRPGAFIPDQACFAFVHIWTQPRVQRRLHKLETGKDCTHISGFIWPRKGPLAKPRWNLRSFPLINKTASQSPARRKGRKEPVRPV